MDQQGRNEVSDPSIGVECTHCSAGVWVYDADGEQCGTVSDWQDKHNFLMVHKGWLFGHDAYIPHAAIKYSDMNGVYLHLRQSDLQDDLTSMQHPSLPQQSAPIHMALPILVPDMGMAAVAAVAFADHALSNRALASSPSAWSAVEATQDITVQVEQEAGQDVGQGSGQATGLVREQISALPEQVKSRRWWLRSNR